jgi:hypothetical protein
MNYCTIQDAWGVSEIGNKFKEYMKTQNSPKLECPKESNPQMQKESFSNIPQANSSNNLYSSDSTNYVPTNNVPQQFNPNQINYGNGSCGNLIHHVYSCPDCSMKMREMFSGNINGSRVKLFDNFKNIIDENRDTIVLILVGIFILMFFNLVNNLTKN